MKLKVNTELPHEPTILVLGIYSRTENIHSQRNLQMNVHNTTIHHSERRTQCLPAGEQISRTWHIPSRDYHLVTDICYNMDRPWKHDAK